MASRQHPTYRNRAGVQHQYGWDPSVHRDGTQDMDYSEMTFNVQKGSVMLTRVESITAYKSQLRGQGRSGTRGQSDTTSDISQHANDMCALEDWPSHARCKRVQIVNESDGQRKSGRGVLKGLKVSKKRFANGSSKLDVRFSVRLGGSTRMNYRSFVDDVVVFMKRKMPLIGVRKWSDIHCSIHRLIVADVLERWELEDTYDTEEKILKIAKERYRGWRSTLHSTYKAYNTDAARMANVPEELQPEEWEWLIAYFGTDSKFQEISQKNSDNRKKQKGKHRVGSKSYSQLSFEKRNLETGEEPDSIALWELTHTKNGIWSNKESQDVYDKARENVLLKEGETEGPVSTEERNNIFQSTYKTTMGCKSTQARGYGYMAKPPTATERFRSQLEDQARATTQFQKHNAELNQQVNELQDQLEAERASTQEKIDLERAERARLEERLKEEREERERLLEEERKSRQLELHALEKSFMEKINEMTNMMGTQQTLIQQIAHKRTGKENTNPNVSRALFQTPGTSGAPGTKNMIPPNQLAQAAKLNPRIFRAMDGNKVPK